MKRITNILLLSMFLVLVGSCVENDPVYENFPGDKVAFSYAVTGDYSLDYLVGSAIQFTNISEETGAVTWDFGDGQTSTEANPTHKYDVAGTYEISLTIDGVGVAKEKLFVSDILSTITTTIDSEVCEVAVTPVNFSVFTPNPSSLDLTYTWILPAGTTNDKGETVTEIVAADPGKLIFNNVGSQKVTLKTKLGERSLQDVVVNVQVGYNKPAKTIYYAVKKGNVMALKVIPEIEDGIGNYPFNMGVKSGQHPMNLLFSDSSLYILDAGSQFAYINDEDGVLGDGAISVMKKDGSSVSVMLSNKGYAFYDPFYGFIDGDKLYFSDRNTGIRCIDKSLRNLSFDVDDSRFAYFVKNNSLLYYNAGYSYGAMNACFTKTADGTWYWAKTYGSAGIYRFKDSDISASDIAVGEAGKPYPIISANVFIKSFVIDESRGMVYYAVRDKGFYKATLADFLTEGKITSTNPGTLVQEMSSDSEGASGEYIDICQMVLDTDDGSVYFGYRKDEVSTVASGLKRYNPATNKIETVIDGVDIYGIAINNEKSKLF
ncbi:MAG: PKD domain-containing protein [Bacteroidaceae bacterium]